MFLINSEKCTLCEACIKECHKDALILAGNAIEFRENKCIMCGHCLAICPERAISIDGDGYSMGEVTDLGTLTGPNADEMRSLIISRRSIHTFSDRQVDDKLINIVLDAARYAPNAMNRQTNAFVVVRNPEKRNELLEDTVSAMERMAERKNREHPGSANYGKILCDQCRNEGIDPIYFRAPVVIFIFTNEEADGIFAAANMVFMAQSLGLGTLTDRLPVRAFLDEHIKEKWCAPEGKDCVMAVLLGYPAYEYKSTVPRKKIQVAVF